MIYYTPKNKMRNGQNRTATKKLIGGRQMNKARVVKDGYPIPSRIFTPQEIKDYFTYDSITCLMCGKDFKALRPQHLKIHGLTVDQYKERYGLPYRKGLCSGEYSARQELRGKELMRSGVFKCLPENREKAHQAIRDGKARINASHKKHSVLNMKGARAKPFTVSDFDKFINYMAENNKIASEAHEYFKGTRNFTRTTLHKFLRSNPEKRLIFEQVSKKIYESRGMTESGRHTGPRDLVHPLTVPVSPCSMGTD